MEKDLLEKFQKSRKVGRSPPLKKAEETESGMNMEKLDKLIKIIQKLKKRYGGN